MRLITTHQINALNDGLTIRVFDEPGEDGVCHHYNIFWNDKDNTLHRCLIKFQDGGPLEECGVNGVSNEALLAIVRDRLESVQDGPYACDEKANALDGVKKAMGALRRRTIRGRQTYGLDGTGSV